MAASEAFSGSLVEIAVACRYEQDSSLWWPQHNDHVYMSFVFYTPKDTMLRPNLTLFKKLGIFSWIYEACETLLFKVPRQVGYLRGTMGKVISNFIGSWITNPMPVPHVLAGAPTRKTNRIKIKYMLTLFSVVYGNAHGSVACQPIWFAFCMSNSEEEDIGRN